MAYTITLEKDEVDTIGLGLGKLPLEQSIGLWLKLRGQVMEAEKATLPEEEPSVQGELPLEQPVA